MICQFVITLKALKSLLCFHMTSSSYDAKVLGDVDPTCIYHHGNIKPDSASVIANCLICGKMCLFVSFICDILGFFICRDKVFGFILITLED